MNTIKLLSTQFNNPNIRAASSLININNRVFACCDDRFGVYELKNDSKWILHNDPLIMPYAKLDSIPKEFKPDFEALVQSMNPDEILLIPSGSKKNRNEVILFNIHSLKFSKLDIKILFEDLASKLKSINIEGAVKGPNSYLFLNRGIGHYKSSIIIIDPKKYNIQSIHEIDLGLLKGFPLHGSELCIFEGHLYLIGVAENSENSYDDGPIIGSAFYKLSLENFDIIDRFEFDQVIKIEGLCRYENQWLISTDPDGIGSSEFYKFS